MPNVSYDGRQSTVLFGGFLMVKVNVCSTSFRTGLYEAQQIRQQLKQTHDLFPSYNAKQLSTICFCGVGVAERFLKDYKAGSN